MPQVPQKIVGPPGTAESGDRDGGAVQKPAVDIDGRLQWIHALIAGARLSWPVGDGTEPERGDGTRKRRPQVRTKSK
jgi:hypothetical protein